MGGVWFLPVCTETLYIMNHHADMLQVSYLCQSPFLNHVQIKLVSEENLGGTINNS